LRPADDPSLVPSAPTASLPPGAGWLLGLIAPPGCVACRSPLRAGMVCGACLRALPWLRGHRCPRCGLPRHRAGCPAAAAAFDRAWAPLAYEGTARDLVGALKFRAALPVAGLMAAHMAANLPADLRAPPEGIPAGAFGVVPVPPHRGRLRRRGFDPAALLAAGVAARAGLPLSACLRRSDRGRRQVGAGRVLRRSAGRFAVAATGPPPRAVLLVDDVHTTGATLDACARALKQSGAAWVGAATYVRTL
jgi:predicted amidophosphoribosyltransferase